MPEAYEFPIVVDAYEKFGVPYPRLSLMVMALMGAILSGAFWLVLANAYSKTQASSDQRDGPPSIQGPNVQQQSEGPNSPNVTTFGPNSPVIINPPGRAWGLPENLLTALTQRLAPFAPEGERRGFITCLVGDSESAQFANTLMTAFRSAGWNLPGTGYSQAIFGGPVHGIVIKAASQNVDDMPGLREFLSVLRQGGIQPVGELDTSLNAGEFRIIVGSKPSPVSAVP